MNLSSVPGDVTDPDICRRAQDLLNDVHELKKCMDKNSTIPLATYPCSGDVIQSFFTLKMSVDGERL